MAVQENAAAVHIKLSSEEKTYLEEIFTPEKVSKLILSSIHCTSWRSHLHHIVDCSLNFALSA